MLTRRTFLSFALASGSLSALGCGPTPPAPSTAAGAGTPPTPPPAPKPTQDPAASKPAAPAGKTLLILGGTRFVGPAVIEAAKAKGYTITLFNRGKTEPNLFPELEKLRGDRDPNKAEGLKALEGRSWDVVLDTSGYVPRIVKASATLLAPRVKQYIFISSVSVYAENTTAGADETARLATIADPTIETMGKEFENYGALKALCEQAAEAAMPGRVTNVRPGYIVGPGDGTDRFTYWPLRVEKGGEMLAPGSPEDPIQIIDVRDLAAWLVNLMETKAMGPFNALGPSAPLTMGGVLEACKAVTGSDARFTWVSAKFLKEPPGEPFELPIWAPVDGDTKEFHTRSFAKAKQTGLVNRPVPDTIKDTLAWFKSLPAERQAKPKAGISVEREKELLAAWRQPAKDKKQKPKPKKTGALDMRYRPHRSVGWLAG
jgi:2'-hydroxyisoflavone reductase